MDVYRGVVRNNVVVLDPDVRLADGLTVEVRVPARSPSVEEILRERGLLQDTRVKTSTVPPADRHPISVTGRPLSEQIIAERS
jgi:hypothetical protein